MSKAWVRRVDPVGLHGFKQGELALEGLQPGLNVVIARNATGKSTLAKAIGLLFDPAKMEKEQLVLGVIDGREGERHVNAKRKSGRYPGFPGEYDQYQLDLLRLIEGFKGGQSPLDAEIGDGMRFAPAPAVGMQRLSEVTAAKEARQRLLDARRDKAGVADVEDLLPRLEQRVEESQEAERITQALEALESKSDSEARLGLLRAEIAKMSSSAPGIELQSPDAINLGKTLLGNLKRALAHFAEAEKRLKIARNDGRRPASPLGLTLRTTLDRLVSELSTLESEILEIGRRNREDTAKAAEARDQVLRLLPVEEDHLPHAKLEDFEALIAAASQADAARMAKLQADAFQAMLADWRKSNPKPDPAIERNLQRLTAWLAAGSASAVDHRPLILCSLLAAFAAVEAAIPTVQVRILAALSAIVFGLIAVMKRPTVSASKPDINDLVVEATPQTVTGQIESLYRQKLASELEAQLEAKAKIVPPDFDWCSVSEELRLKCQNPYALAPLSTSLSAYHQARISAAESADRLSTLRAAEEEKRLGVLEILTSFDFPTPSGQEIATVESFKSWFDRSEDLDRAEKDALAAEAALTNFLANNGISGFADPESALAELSRRAEMAQRYHAAVREVGNLEFSISKNSIDTNLLEKALSGRSPQDLNSSQIAEIRSHFEKVAAELPARRQALSDARSKVQAAERASIPEREHAYEAALSKVEVKFEQLVRQAVRARIGKVIQERLRTTELPDVVRRASGYLESFTEGRFRLEIGADRSEGLGMLVVRDKNRELQEFEHLSTGTKVHAVIAIRLAVIQSQEQKAAERTGIVTRFPLIADEALAVSDPECSQEIAQHLASIAKDRQVIVFTNDPNEVALFRRFDRSVNVIHLDEKDTEQALAPSKKTRKPEPSPLPVGTQLGLDI